MGSTIGEILIREKILTQEQLKSALDFQKKHDVSLGSAIISLGFLSAEEMAQGLSRQLGYPYIDLDQFEVYPDVINLIQPEAAKRYLIMPIHRIRSFLTLAMVDPTDMDIIEDVRFRTGLSIQPVIASEIGVLNAIRKYYGGSSALRPKKSIENIALADDSKVMIVEEVTEEEAEEGEGTTIVDEAPVITLVNNIFVEGIKRGASDVHIEPYERSFRIRYRIDGILYESMNLPMKFKDPVTSRIKIMSNMNIAEHRLPQDGRIKIRLSGKEIDIRVSVIPISFGERVVMRILEKGTFLFSLEQLGMAKQDFELVDRLIIQSHGIILVTGPTGSGKSTTLYAALQRVNSDDKNIITVEDPIEYQMPGIGQIQVRPKIGLTFAMGLRHILRQDPDVILIGEIRDHETAEMAIQASLTGHLVFATLHTNDSAGAITRLVNMGIEPFLVTSSTIAIMAQRLMRRICPECKEPYEPELASLRELGVAAQEFAGKPVYFGRGCTRCQSRGYYGRTGIFELLVMTPHVQDLVLKGTDSNVIKREAKKYGMRTLREDGAAKVALGISTIEEVLRVTRDDIVDEIMV